MDGMKTDDQLLRGALRGRSEDFGTLTERYYRLVYGIAFSYTGNPSDAEDLTQESFLKAYRSLDTLRDIARFRAWLLRIVRNECLNWQTRKKHQDVLARCERLSPDTTVSDAEREDLFDFLWRELDELDEQFREVLTVYYFHEKNTREVAQKLDISVSAAEKRLQRARQLLGERLASRLDEALTPHHPDILRAKRVSQAVIAIPLSWDSAKVAALLGATHAAGTATGNVAAYLALAFVLGSGALMVYSVGQKGFRKPIDFGVASSAQAYEDRSRRPVTTSPIPDPSVPNVSSAGANLRSRPDFTVRVLTNGGARTPVAGARVTVFAPGSDKILAVTDERGEANFADVPLGDIGVSVVHGDYLNQRRTHLRLARGGSIDVIVAKGNAIEGRVFDAATGKPLEEFNLELIGAEPTGSEPWSYGPAPIRNKEGRFGITNLESAFALAVSAPGYSRFESRLALTRNPQSVDVAMQRAATIEGLVTDRFGQPVPGADIAFTLPHIRPGTNAETINMTRSTIDGKYSIPFTDSRYPLLVISKAGFVTQLESIPTNTIPGTTLRRNFALARTSTVRGVVRYDRRPYEGAIVNAGRGVTAMTDSFGRFIMHNVDPTTTTICATLPRRSDNQASDMTMGRSVILEEGGEQIIDFNFDRPTSAVMGFVAVDGAIDNDYDVRIRAELVGQGGVIRMEATTRAGETYLFEQLPPGKLQLAVAVYLHGGPRLRRTVHVELLPDQTLVQDIVVTVPLSLVHGRVLGIPADCTATAWLLPGTHRPTGEKFDAQVTDSQEILPDGKIEFTAVEPGHYTILVAGYPKGPESTGKRGRPGMAVATSGGRASKWFDLDFSNDFERMQTWHLDAYPWVATVNVDVQDGQKTEVEISL